LHACCLPHYCCWLIVPSIDRSAVMMARAARRAAAAAPRVMAPPPLRLTASSPLPTIA
jgi:hypothetical protein